MRLMIATLATATLTFVAAGQQIPKPADVGSSAPSTSKTDIPGGWRSGAPPNSHSEDYEMGVDTSEKHGGKVSAYIELKTAESKDSPPSRKALKPMRIGGKESVFRRS